MSNEIMKVTATEAIAIGKQFFESGLFIDLKNAGQAVVKIMAGAEIGIPPFAALSGIHIIQGKPTIGAGLMASAVKGSGKYDYRVIEQTEKNCSIDFFQGKDKIGNSSFSLADAQKAGTKNIDKYPRNMLFARAISNGIKWFCPDVFAGPVYTPEEMNIVTEDTTAEITTIDPAAAAIAEMYLCTTLDCLAETWKKYKSLQKNPAFAKAKDDHKIFLSKDTKELAHEVNGGLDIEAELAKERAGH